MLKGLLFPDWGLDLVPVAPQFSASADHLIVFTWLPSCTLLVMSSSQCIQTSALSRGLFDSCLWHVLSGCWCILVCVPGYLKSLLLYQSWVLVERKIRTSTNQVHRSIIKSFLSKCIKGPSLHTNMQIPTNMNTKRCLLLNESPQKTSTAVLRKNVTILFSFWWWMSAGNRTELLFDYAESDRPLLSSDKMHNSSTRYKAGS